jgi:hypothetical protein
VYINYKGGTATKFQQDVGGDVAVAALDLSQFDIRLQGSEDLLFTGSGAFTGLLDNLNTIFTTPATGDLNFHIIDLDNPADVAAYQAAADGLWVTIDNPASLGLNSQTDFTTVFLGQANSLVFGLGTLGISSIEDIANMSKADNVILFAQEYMLLSFETTVSGILGDYATAFANDIAHELGHVLGLPHTEAYTIADDGAFGFLPSVMAAGAVQSYPYDWTSSLWRLGTARLYTTEFPVGDVDMCTSLVSWLR